MAEQSEYRTPDEYLEEERIEEAVNPDEQEDSEDLDQVTEADEDIIKVFQKNKIAMENKWNPIYDEMEDDWNVYLLNQWTEQAKTARSGRPMVTVDITRKFPKSIVAEAYRNPKAVKLTARNDSASGKAKGLSDGIRYQENRSGAIYAYTWASECAAVAGLGWLNPFYGEDEQQQQTVLGVKRVADPLGWMIDEDSRELDGSDMLYAMQIHGKIDKQDKYTYWWKSKRTEKVGTGEIVINADGVEEYETKSITRMVVSWAIICDDVVKEKELWPTSDIPIVPMYGELFYIRQKPKLFGIVRAIKDTQRSLNYVISEGMERLALTPKDPIIAQLGSIPTEHQADWRDSMKNPKGILWWKAFDDDGKPYTQPMRANTTPDTAWLSPLIIQLQQNAKEATGIYDTALGQTNGVDSGVAIGKKIEAGDRGQLVYDEHSQISIKQVGRILLDLQHVVLGDGGILPTLTEEGKSEVLEFGIDEQGNQVSDITDLDPSDLDISVSAAPAYATRKKEGVETIMEMFQHLDPVDRAKLAPKVIRDLDVPGADAYADILDPPMDDVSPEMIMQQMQEVQGAFEQSQAANEELQNQNTQLAFEVQNNTQVVMQKATMDNQTKLAINEQNNEVRIFEINAKINADAESDNKNIMNDQSKAATDAQLKIAEIGQKAEAENNKTALAAQKMQNDEIEKIEVQPVAIVEPQGLVE